MKNTHCPDCGGRKNYTGHGQCLCPPETKPSLTHVSGVMLHYNNLISFLRCHACNSTAHDLIDQLEVPLTLITQHIEQPISWHLVSQDVLYLSHLTQFISQLTNQSLRWTTFPVQQPFPKPDWMNEFFYRQLVWKALQDTLGRPFGTCLDNCFHQKVRSQLPLDLLQDLCDSCDTLTPYLHRSLSRDLRLISPHLHFCHMITDNIARSITYACSHAILGDQPQTTRLIHVLSAYGRGFMPLGFKRQETDTLILLTK